MKPFLLKHLILIIVGIVIWNFLEKFGKNDVKPERNTAKNYYAWVSNAFLTAI